MTQPNQWTGGCQCGAVRYAISAPPEAACICHCRMCQKASGQPFMAFARTRLGSLRWTRGRPAIFMSSSLAERGFCRQCGTPLTYRFVRQNLHVTIGSLDQPNAVVPTEQYGVESELPWCATLDDLPRLRTEDDMGDDMAARFVNHQHPDHDT